jgi:carboxymethylenebutenolidase
MSRPALKLLAALAIVAFTVSLSAQDWAKAALEKSPRHREYVAIKHGDRTVQAFVVYPEVSHKAPVVLLIHEIFGLSDWAKEMADELAAQGFIVVAPDLLTGFGPNGGGTDAFPGQDAVTKAVSGLRRQPGYRRPGCGGGLRQEAALGQRQALRRGLLLGRRQVVRVRHPSA